MKRTLFFTVLCALATVFFAFSVMYENGMKTRKIFVK